MDLRARVDQMLAAPKTILGTPQWKIGQRPDWREMRRTLLEDGEARGAFLISHAYPRTDDHEFRDMIVLWPEGGTRKDGRSVCRLDNAPTVSGPHINDFAGPLGIQRAKSRTSITTIGQETGTWPKRGNFPQSCCMREILRVESIT